MILFKKKKKALIDKILPLLLTILTIAIVMQFLIGWTLQMKINQESENLIRQYILKMEAIGYLTPSDKILLEDSLNEIGITVSDWGRTTMTQTGYGETIILEINGQAENQMWVMEIFGKLTKEGDTMPFHKIRTSTAKW